MIFKKIIYKVKCGFRRHLGYRCLQWSASFVRSVSLCGVQRLFVDAGVCAPSLRHDASRHNYHRLDRLHRTGFQWSLRFIDILRWVYTMCCNMYTELPRWACEISWVLTIQTGYHHHHMVAPLIGASSSSGAIFRTTKYAVYENVISTQSSFWRCQTLISGPCVQHLSHSHQKPLGFTPKAWFFAEK